MKDRFIKLKDHIIKVKDIVCIEKVEDSLIFYMTTTSFPIEIEKSEKPFCDCTKVFTDLCVDLIKDDFLDFCDVIVNRRYVSEAVIDSNEVDGDKYHSIVIYWNGNEVHTDIIDRVVFDKNTPLSSIYMVLDRLGGFSV